MVIIRRDDNHNEVVWKNNLLNKYMKAGPGMMGPKKYLAFAGISKRAGLFFRNDSGYAVITFAPSSIEVTYTSGNCPYWSL